MTTQQITKRNYIMMILEGTLFNIGLSFIQADTIIAQFIDYTTNSTAMIGLAVSMGSIMFLLGQFIGGTFIHKVRVQSKFMWRMGLISRTMMLVMAASLALGARGKLSAALFIALYAVNFLADGVLSLCWSQVAARTLPVRTRGEVISMQQALSGVVGLLTGTALQRILSSSLEKYSQFTVIFLCSGGVLMFSVVALALIRDVPHASTPQIPAKNPIKYIGELIPLFGQHRGMRQTTYSRCIFMLTLMSLPINYKFGQVNGLTAYQLSMLVYMPIAGRIVAGILWSQMSKRKGYPVMMMAGHALGLACAALNIIAYIMAAAGLPFMVPLAASMILVTVNQQAYIGFSQHVIAIVGEDVRASYIVLMALIAAPMALSSTLAGFIADSAGYLPVYIIMVCAGVVGLIQTHHFFISKKSPLPAEQTNRAQAG